MALPDELTPEQMAQLKAGNQPMQATGPAFDAAPPVDVPQGTPATAFEQAPETLTIDEMARAKVDRNLSGRFDENLAQGLQGPSIDAIQSANVGAAAKAFYGKENGWLENTFYALTIPEQFMARQVVNILENAGSLTTEDAREILARDQVHGSDIVNFYWRDPTSWYGKTGRFVAGMAADILIDPLSYVGFGALTNAAKQVTIGSKTISGLDKMSKAERAYYKTLEAVEKVIKTDGEFAHETMSAMDVAIQNEAAIAKARDSQLGFDALQTTLLASPNAKEQMINTVRVGMTEKSWAQEWKEGSRGLTFGARMPFTDAAFEVDMPGPLSKLAELPVRALDGTYDFAKSLVRSTGWGDAAYNLVADIGTRTGKFLFDAQQNIRLGNKTALQEELGQFAGESRKLLVSKQREMGPDKFSQLLEDIVEEIENPAFAETDAFDLARKFGATEDDARALVQRSNSMEATARRSRLNQNPDVMDMIDDMSSMMKASAAEYKARGLPFEELNPFGPGWASGYIKHQVSDQFLKKFREVNNASDVIGEALKLTPELAGKVDTSALGRSYRGTIREANTASLEKYGVKMFVDDPVELILQRKEEMSKVLADHDLMEAALPYAVKGTNPGQGYVKFNPDHFKRLSIDQSDQFAHKWDAFIPEGYKTGESIYLPEDVYDRMNFVINGWQTPKSLSKVLSAADFYTTVWRNNALFGASYIGLNAFSNALTYLSYNDLGGPGALAKATAMLTPFGKNVVIDTPHLGAMTAETVMQLAHEKNLLNSSFAKGVEFQKLAEHVASNKEARQTIGQKAMNVADYAFLWRYSRGLAQFADEVPKLATFVSRLEKGFSVDGAAELAERYFYNFNNMSKIQTGVSRLIPFSSFPMKTAELVYEQARTGHLAALTIPGKVQAALDGSFVQDNEARGALDQMLPGYKNILHPIHGEIMPGMREIQLDIPWSYGTLDTIFHPEKANHPVAQLLSLAGSWNNTDEEAWAEGARQRQIMMSQNLDLFVPSYMREALTLAEINGAMDLGGYFKDRYLATMPTRTQWERGLSGRDTGDKGTIYQKFTNAAEFGQAMDAKYGENWLYNLLFYNRPDTNDAVSMQEAGARGEWIRRRVRQFSMGLASMTKLDSNFFMNSFAIKRQIDIKQRALKAEIAQSGALMDAERISDPEFLKQLADNRPLAKELLALDYKKDALHEYYDFFLGADKKLPENMNLVDIIFGTNEAQFDYRDKPDKEVYQKLHKRQTMENISDDDANELIESTYDKEAGGG